MSKLALLVALSCLSANPACLAQLGSDVEGVTLAECNSAKACLEQLRNHSTSEAGIGGSDRAFVARLLSYGPDVIPDVVETLASKNRSAAELAAYILRESPQLDSQFLPHIRAGLDRKLGWLPPALCRMDSDDAALEALERFVHSDSAPHNQEAYALKLCGRRVVPHIVAAAHCRTGCSSERQFMLGLALSVLGDERADAWPELMQLASDSTTPPEIAIGSLRMIAQIGDLARDAEPILRTLRSDQPSLADVIDDVLVAIKADAAGEIFVDRLKARPSVMALRDLAEVGIAGESAGPVVVDLLENEDWAVRIAAARALGYIGHRDASAPLIRLLSNTEDVRLAWVAAESLGRLQSHEATPALRTIALHHWYPPVQRAASRAVTGIEDGRGYAATTLPGNFPVEFFEYEDFGRSQSICQAPILHPKVEDQSRKLFALNKDGGLRDLAYSSAAIRLDPGTSTDDDEYSPAGDIDLSDIESTIPSSPAQRLPHVALRVDDGWLAGSDRGEWGGELVFINDNERIEMIVEDNVEDIYLLGGEIVALTGLSHLGSNHGAVHRVRRDASGRWTAKQWRALPGAPQSSWTVETGEILVNMYNGGTILLDASGAFRVAPCADPQTDIR